MDFITIKTKQDSLHLHADIKNTNFVVNYHPEEIQDLNPNPNPNC